LFSASKVLALIAVNGAIAGTLILKDDAATTPDLDVAPAGAIQQGWTYVVTVAGTFTQKVRRGDFSKLAPTTHYTSNNKTSRLFFPLLQQ
jgi:hypothetical protein